MILLTEVFILLFLTFCVVTISKSTLFQKLSSQESRKSSKHSKDQGNSFSPRYNEKPYKLPPLKSGTSSRMTMGLKRLDHFNWLTIDDQYFVEHSIRSFHLSHHGPSVLQCLPGSETACQEVLSLVASFLTSHYPSMFTSSGHGSGRLIHNLKTGETFPVINNSRPLEAAARLAMEDFNILIKDPNDGRYRLQASATLFPAGWKLEDRIGWTIGMLHSPVPGWEERLGCSVNRYFDHLSPSTAMERYSLFVQTSPELFQDQSLCTLFASLEPSTDTLTHTEPIPAGESHGSHNSVIRPKAIPDRISSTDPNASSSSSIAASGPRSPYPSEMYIRRERQTFTRLPISNAILFTVRTYLMPLTSLGDEELAAFVEQAEHWSDETAAYKGRDAWLDTVLTYQASRRERIGG